MQVGTTALAKYFNGIADPKEAQKYQDELVANFKTVGMSAFGQMPFGKTCGGKGNTNKSLGWRNL